VERARQDLLRDPVFDGFAAVAAALRRGLRHDTDDPDVRARVIDVLGALPFEAYVACARRESLGAETEEACFSRLLQAVLFDRMQKFRTSAVRVHAMPGKRGALISSVVAACAAKVSRAHGKVAGVPPPIAAPAAPNAPCGWIADYACAITTARLAAVVPADVRAFERIRTKVRVVRDLDRKAFYWRRAPLP
jgi:hypothetical protein